MPAPSRDRIGNALGLWVEWVQRHAWQVVVIGVLSALLAIAYAARNLGVNTDPSAMFPDTLPWRSVYLDYKRAFPVHSNTLLVVVDAQTPDLAEQAAGRLADAIESEVGLTEWVYRPGGDEHFVRNGLLYLSTDELQGITDDLALMQPFLARLEQDTSLAGLFDIMSLAVDAAADGQSVDLTRLFDQLSEAIDAALAGRFYSVSWQGLMLEQADLFAQSQRVVFVKLIVDYSDLFPAGDAIEGIRAIADELGLDEAHGVRVRLTGSLALSHEEMQAVSQGMAATGLLALLGVGLVLMLGLRSLRLVFACFVTLLVGLSWTSAFAAFAVGQLNLISIAFAVLYIGLGLDYAIHFCLRYQELVTAGETPSAAMRQTAMDVGASLAMCALTTGAGFLAFVPTDFRGVSELGIISGTGIFIGLIANLSILPALLCLVARRPGRRRVMSRLNIPAALPSFLSRARPGILSIAAVLAVVCLLSLNWVRFDRNPLNVRAADAESVVTLQELVAKSGESPWTLVALADSLSEATELAETLADLDTVRNTRTLADFIPKDQEEKLDLVEQLSIVLGFDPIPPEQYTSTSMEAELASIVQLRTAVAAFVTARPGGDGAQSAQRLLDALMNLETRLRGPDGAQVMKRVELSILETLPAQLERLRLSLDADFVTVDSLPESLTRRWVSEAGQHRVEITPRGDMDDPAALARFVEQVRSVAPNATESAALNYESGNTVARAFRQAMVVAFIVVSLVLVLMFRGVRYPLVVLTPLLLALGLTTATMVVLGLAFNYANIITLPLLLGIGVDSGIHMVHRARAVASKHVQLLHTSTTRAIITSTLAMICSFGNLAFSPHRGTASMGTVLTMGMLYILLCALVLVPALLANSSRMPATPGGKRT